MENQIYDPIAEEYKNSKELPFRKYVETYSLFQIAGNVSGLNVLDLACGEGFYTRKLKQVGAFNVSGVDISSEMIHLAEAEEQKNPIGCQYLVHDVATLPELGSFDLAVAMYLLNYASSKAMLLSFCKAVYNQLKKGGKFIGYNDNILVNPSQCATYRPYGFTKECAPERKEGDPTLYTIFNADGSSFQFNNYYLHPETYAEAFTEAGFVNFNWVSPMLNPSQKGNPYWDRFIAHPPIIGFEAQKV